MKKNVHHIERIVRIIVGLAIISLVFIGPQSAWGWVGLIPLATGIIGWCPPYALVDWGQTPLSGDRPLFLLKEIPMIGYVVLGTNDLARAASFYDELLAEMGVTRMMELGERGYAWAAAMDKPMLCIMTPYDGQPATVGNGVMAGIAADSQDQVDRIYKKAIELGGSDEGPPGLRAGGGEGFYAAYFRDLDGNKLDVFTYSWIAEVSEGLLKNVANSTEVEFRVER